MWQYKRYANACVFSYAHEIDRNTHSYSGLTYKYMHTLTYSNTHTQAHARTRLWPWLLSSCPSECVKPSSPNHTSCCWNNWSSYYVSFISLPNVTDCDYWPTRSLGPLLFVNQQWAASDLQLRFVGQDTNGGGNVDAESTYDCAGYICWYIYLEVKLFTFIAFVGIPSAQET